MEKNVEKELTFLDHLDELRKILFRIAIVVVAVMVVVFLSKETLFDVILAPSQPDFATYRLLCRLAEWVSLPDICPDAFRVEFINTELPAQFMIHMNMAFYAGILLVFPYILYQIYRFVSSALYEHERKYASGVIFFSSLLFFTGVLLNYFLIFPLSFRFLVTYQVNVKVPNVTSISSYIDILKMLSLTTGVMFELPIISWLFAKLGFLSASFMKKYRRHAVVLILFIAAIITPTTDIPTLMLVFVPIYLLYEVSIWVVKITAGKKKKTGPIEEEGWESPYDV